MLKFPFTSSELPSLLHSEKSTSYSLFDKHDPIELLGFGQLIEQAPGIIRLARVIVSPKHRGLRLGKVLCERLFSEASKYGHVEKLTLAVYRDNPAAIALYQNLGFVEVLPAPRPGRPDQHEAELKCIQRLEAHGVAFGLSLRKL